MRRATPWLLIALFPLLGHASPPDVPGGKTLTRASAEHADAPNPSSIRPTLTLVIDDLGLNPARDGRVLALPGPVTLAILPDTRHATRLAERAHAAGNTVMLHLPMAPATGPYAWHPDMSPEQLQQRLALALEKVPHASGVNNHMGSQMTEHRQPMLALMAELQTRHLFFLDSRTSARTVAAAAAQEVELASLSRDIFLDDDPSPSAVAAQFQSAITLARKQGSVVVIGHPHASTLAMLERELPRLQALGIDWIDIGQMIATRGNRAMPAHGSQGVYR